MKGRDGTRYAHKADFCLKGTWVVGKLRCMYAFWTVGVNFKSGAKLRGQEEGEVPVHWAQCGLVGKNGSCCHKITVSQFVNECSVQVGSKPLFSCLYKGVNSSTYPAYMYGWFINQMRSSIWMHFVGGRVLSKWELIWTELWLLRLTKRKGRMSHKDE